MDRERMERGIRLFLEGVGASCEHGDLGRTPARVARAWEEDLVSGYAVDPIDELSWTEVDGEPGPVVVRSIALASICAHHLLPFFGVAHVAYLPARRQAGLSKLARVVDAHARRLQTQEHLTDSIVDTLDRGLEPRGVLAALEAEHTCMTLRGVRQVGSRMLTIGTSGVYRDDSAARAEMLRILNPGAR